ncbi:MAG: 6-bladed beta-propeller, partial [Tannerellaceae bacterium]|nr:6-bladed beta-propeller [Tannerellaceae bacterium]
MKRLHLIPAIILFVVTAGCGDNKHSDDGLITVDVTATYPKKELILQDFLDVEYIPLETNDEFITSANLRIVNKDILIVTNTNRMGEGNIFIFDRNGR